MAKTPTFRGGFVNWGDKQGLPNSQDIQAFLQSASLSVQAAFANTIMRGATNTSALYLLSGCTRGTGIGAGFAMYYDSSATDDFSTTQPRYIFGPVAAVSSVATINLYKRTVTANFYDGTGAAPTPGDTYYEYAFGGAVPPGNFWDSTPYKSSISTYGSTVFDLTNGMWNVPTVATQAQVQASKRPGTYYVTGIISHQASGVSFGDTNSVWAVEVYGWGGVPKNFTITGGNTDRTLITIDYRLISQQPNVFLSQFSDNNGSTWSTFLQAGVTYYISYTEPAIKSPGAIWMDIS
jgi:hypothetical protein